MPVRKIPKNYRNVTGVSATGGTIGEAHFESTLEQDLILLMEFHPERVSIEVQPMEILFNDPQGKKRKYTPDLQVYFSDETSIVYEVKHRKDLKENWVELKPKFKAAIHHAKLNGWKFKIVTEIEIRTPYLKNLQFLKRYRRFKNTMIHPRSDQLKEILSNSGKSTPNELVKGACKYKWNRAEVLYVIWQLLALDYFKADLSQPLNMNSPIWINKGASE